MQFLKTKKSYIVLYFAISVLIVSFLLWQYVFLIYEVKIELTSNRIKLSENNTVTLIAFPLNSMGKKIPLRDVEINFEIVEGEELVDPLVLNDAERKAVFTPQGKIGTVRIIVDCKYSLSSTKLILEITE